MELPDEEQIALWAVYVGDLEPSPIGWPSFAHLELWRRKLVAKDHDFRVQLTAAGLRTLGVKPELALVETPSPKTRAWCAQCDEIGGHAFGCPAAGQ